MRRISDEDGGLAGARNWGRFALSLIPGAIGGAALLWLAVWVGWIDLARERRIERRSMNSVGIASIPTEPIGILHHDAACLKIESSFLDGNELVFYTKNMCDRWLNRPNFLWRMQAHNGAVIGSGRYAFDNDKAFGPGELREQRITSMHDDDRTERVEVYVFD